VVVEVTVGLCRIKRRRRSRCWGDRDVGPRPLRLALAEARRGPHRAVARRHHRCPCEEGGDVADGTAAASASSSPATGREEEGAEVVVLSACI
jgi:hypothetical protein